MNRLERLVAIIISMHSKRSVKVKELASKFGISQRTVFRDMRSLNEAGLPLYHSPGMGYRLVEGHTLPPIVFTETEANALLTAEKVLSKNSDSSLIISYQMAMDKVRSVMRNLDREKLDLLEQRIAPSTNKFETSSKHLSDLQLAITRRAVVEIKYQALYNQQVSRRKVEPLAIYFTHTHWIMIAHCQLRNGLREFRLDRILELIIHSATFPDYEFDLQNYFEKIANS